jgi:carbon monoxide dehydrogenase subunit G
MRTSVMALGAALALTAGAARAEVADRSAAGFEVVERATIAAPPAKVWEALVHPERWWDPNHTWSKDAKNLSIDLAGGCFCEKLPHGSVRHMTVAYADGETQLRMFGGIGPLQLTGAAGHLGVRLKPVGGATEVTMTYDVGGYAKGGLAETFAAPVDQVLGQQVARLKKAVETGTAD